MMIPTKNAATITILQENKVMDLNEILADYYDGEVTPYEERAFKRVLQWKEDFKRITKDYPHVTWEMLAAVVKAETQGKTGRQVSNAMAVGMPQIKYQGAWAFFWDAAFSQKIDDGAFWVKDYYNARIRLRYSLQLKRIKQYLQSEGLLVMPVSSCRSATTYRQARSGTWANLKIHLRRNYRPGEYQVAVDIAAMYIDHLIDTFQQVGRQVREIKQYVEQNQIAGIHDIQVSGTTSIRLKRIEEYLAKRSKNTTIIDIQRLTLTHINNILNRFEDPNTYLSAYNFGLKNTLDYIHAEKNLPEEIKSYANRVATYDIIFQKIEKFSVFV